MAGPNRTGILPHRFVPYIMELILNRPMATDQLQQMRGIGLFFRKTGDATNDLLSRLAMLGDGARHAKTLFQTLPRFKTGQDRSAF